MHWLAAQIAACQCVKLILCSKRSVEWTLMYTCQEIGADFTKASVIQPVLRKMKRKPITVVSLHLKLYNPELEIYKGSSQWATALHNGKGCAASTELRMF